MSSKIIRVDDRVNSDHLLLEVTMERREEEDGRKRKIEREQFRCKERIQNFVRQGAEGKERARGEWAEEYEERGGNIEIYK